MRTDIQTQVSGNLLQITTTHCYFINTLCWLKSVTEIINNDRVENILVAVELELG